MSRMHHGAVCFLRLVVVMAVNLARQVSGSGGKEAFAIEKFVRTETESGALDRLTRTAGHCYQYLITEVKGEDSSLGTLLQSALYILTTDEAFCLGSGDFSSKKGLGVVEMAAQGHLLNAARDISHSIHQQVSSSWHSNQREKILESALGKEMWGMITSDDPANVWVHTTPVSMEVFSAAFSKIEDRQQRYPLLSGFLEQEGRLQHVKHIIPILEWHRILFQIFPNGEISREEASNITNEDAIKRLPAAEQPAAWDVLRRFCDAFNASFHLTFHNYNGCVENPFLIPGSLKIDLGCTFNSANPQPPESMSPSISICFSFPAYGKSQDMASLATKVLVLRLLRIQRDVLRLTQPTEDLGEFEVDPEDEFNRRNRTSWAEISCETSPHNMRKYLVGYERQSMFMPLLHISAESDQKSFNFNWNIIEKGLLSGIFSGKQQIRLFLRSYSYRGEVRDNDFKKLAMLIPQENLGHSIVDLIRSETGTLEKQIGLLSHIEIVTNFLLSLVDGFDIKELAGGRTLLRCDIQRFVCVHSSFIS